MIFVLLLVSYAFANTNIEEADDLYDSTVHKVEVTSNSEPHFFIINTTKQNEMWNVLKGNKPTPGNVYVKIAYGFALNKYTQLWKTMYACIGLKSYVKNVTLEMLENQDKRKDYVGSWYEKPNMYCKVPDTKDTVENQAQELRFKLEQSPSYDEIYVVIINKCKIDSDYLCPDDSMFIDTHYRKDTGNNDCFSFNSENSDYPVLPNNDFRYSSPIQVEASNEDTPKRSYVYYMPYDGQASIHYSFEGKSAKVYYTDDTSLKCYGKAKNDLCFSNDASEGYLDAEIDKTKLLKIAFASDKDVTVQVLITDNTSTTMVILLLSLVLLLI